MTLDYEAIGKRIKSTRLKKKLTQEKLSEMIDISPSHLSNIETGSTRVSLTTIVKLANALEVTVDNLLCDSLTHSRVQFEEDFSRLLEDCNEYELRMIVEMAEALKTSLRRGNALYLKSE